MIGAKAKESKLIRTAVRHLVSPAVAQELREYIAGSCDQQQ
jgi:hypothetical protein